VEVAQRAGGLGDDRPYRVLLLLTDGLLRDQENILRGCYSVLGAGVPLFGGAAADGWRMTGTYLMADGKVLTDAVVAAMIASEAPLAVAVRHGWRHVGEPILVTGTANGRVLTLNDRPAMDVYLERLGAPPQAYTDAAEFVAFALARPIGVQRRSGIGAHNISTEVDIEGRSIGGGNAIDQGAPVWVMEGDERSILDAAEAACREACAGPPASAGPARRSSAPARRRASRSEWRWPARAHRPAPPGGRSAGPAAGPGPVLRGTR